MNAEGTIASCPIPESEQSAAVRRHVGASAPAPLRLMAARGMAPMPPADLVTAQFVLSFDPDAKVAEAAKKSLSNLDARIANAILGDTQIHPQVLGHLAVALAENDAFAERLLLNPSTPTSAFVRVAEVCSEAISEIIANNQARLLDTPEIARSLTKNARVLRSTIDRAVDFLVRAGVIVDGLREFEEALFRLTGEERMKAAEAVAVPRDLLDESLLTREERAELEPARQMIAEGDEAEVDERVQSLEQRLRNMTSGQKIAAATKGNKQVRGICLRDTNRLVAIAAVTSPLITESEIVTISQSRSVHQDVIGHICRDKKNNWVRLYPVKVGLSQNPKTPLAEALKLLPHLQKKDLKGISSSRNVPSAVRTLAGSLLRGKS